MTDPFDAAPDPDDRPQPPARATAPGRPASAAHPAPSRLRRVVRGWLGASLVLGAACIVCALIGAGPFHLLPLHVQVHGDDLGNGLSIEGVSEGGKVLLAIGGMLFALLLLLLLPVLLLMLLAVVCFALILGLALPLVGLVLALVVVTSPLWMIATIVWFVARDRHPLPRPAPSATIRP